MQSKYEAPELTMIGRASEVVMGSDGCGVDVPHQVAADFEFEQDNL